jgi:hypothetical protein
MTTRTTLTGGIDRLEVTPGVDVELGDEVYLIVRARLASDTEVITAEEDKRTVKLAANEVALAEGQLRDVARLAIVNRLTELDRAAGRPPLDNDEEDVAPFAEARADADLEEALAVAEAELLGDDPADPVAAAERLDEAVEDYLGDGDLDGDLELPDDPEGADEEAPAGEPGPFDEADERAPIYLVGGKRYTPAEVEEARERVRAAFGTDYIDGTAAELIADLDAINHVAGWLLRDVLVVEATAGARLEALDWLRARIEAVDAYYASEEPWPGYLKSTVDTVLGHLDRVRPDEEARGNWPELAEHVRTFEAAHKARKTIAEAIDTLLERIPEAPDPVLEDVDGFEPTADEDDPEA